MESSCGYTYLFEAISHCAIPLFLMLTGVYVIDKANNIESRIFYKKSAKKLGIPLVIFICIYYVYDICITKTKTVDSIYDGIKTGFSGMYAHWYMIMLMVVYAFMPLIAHIKNTVSHKAWEKGVVIFFLWAMLSAQYSSSQASWSLTNMYLIGYVLLGNVIHQRLLKYQKNNVKGAMFIIVGIFVLAIDGTLLKCVVMSGGDYYNKLINMYAAPLIILGAICIFIGFSFLSIRKDIGWLSATSYIVYLSHKLLIEIVSQSLYPVLERKFSYDVRFLIFIEYIIILPLAILLGFVLYKLINLVFYRSR